MFLKYILEERENYKYKLSSQVKKYNISLIKNRLNNTQKKNTINIELKTESWLCI